MNKIFPRLGIFVSILFSVLSISELSAQANDIIITSVDLVGPNSLCPSSSVSFTVTFNNNGSSAQTLTGETAHIYLTGAAVATESLAALTINAGQSSTVTFASGLNLNTPGNYSLTVSFTNTGDEDISNDVGVLNGINVFSPVTPTLSSTASSVCYGDPITFTITPYSATATYTFYLNGGNKRSLLGVNTITYSAALGNPLSDNDKVTYEFIDSNACSIDTSTQSITATVEAFSLSLTTNNAGSNNTFVAGSNIEIEASSDQNGLTYDFSVGATEFKTITPAGGTASFTAAGADLGILTGQGVLKVEASSSAGLCLKDEEIPFTIFL